MIRLCRHCGRKGIRGFTHILYLDGRDAGWVCTNIHACSRREDGLRRSGDG